MTKIVIEKNIKDCSDCEFRRVEIVYTADSFERPERWECEKMIDPKTKKLKVITGYHDWSDHEEIPKWCPIRAK